jgi:hypothetical protein
MELTPEQLAICKSEDPKILLELKDLEVFAIYSLGQMNHKVVRMSETFFGNTQVGLFVIEEINGEKDLDFSSPEKWLHLDLKSIRVTLISPNEFGGSSTLSFNSLFYIKSIALLGL